MRRLLYLRRFTAVVAQLLLLQLVFASGVGACPLEAGSAQAAGMHMAEDGASHSQHATGSNTTTKRAPAAPDSQHHDGAHCTMACVPANCSSAGHCSASVTTAGDATSRRVEIAQTVVPLGNVPAPRSVNSAPEPPPPRA